MNEELNCPDEEGIPPVLPQDFPPEEKEKTEPIDQNGELPPDPPPPSKEKKPSLDEGIYPWQAVLCYIPGMFWFPVLLHARSRFLWHHGSQGFRLTLLALLQTGLLVLAGWIVPPAHTTLLNRGTSFAVEMMTGEGRMILLTLGLVFALIQAYFLLCGVINAFGGTYSTLPLIGRIGFGSGKKAKKK